MRINMKNTVILTISLWLLPLSVFASSGQVVKIGVTGMVCEFCVASVEKGLKALPGVKQVKVSLKDKHAEIIMSDDKSIDESKVRKIIKEAGFTPGEIQIH